VKGLELVEDRLRVLLRGLLHLAAGCPRDTAMGQVVVDAVGPSVLCGPVRLWALGPVSISSSRAVP
jgi:hypothetical protein